MNISKNGVYNISNNRGNYVTRHFDDLGVIVMAATGSLLQKKDTDQQHFRVVVESYNFAFPFNAIQRCKLDLCADCKVFTTFPTCHCRLIRNSHCCSNSASNMRVLPLSWGAVNNMLVFHWSKKHYNDIRLSCAFEGACPPSTPHQAQSKRHAFMRHHKTHITCFIISSHFRTEADL